ncbi:MAG: trehalose-6-phosphate synthase, partial [Patescibacteria group bacterium]|nr:trehalose-6-phosphate synthase [Patescibacteria group bacterium]
AFHRGYQARNFLQCVERELEARIDLETNKVYYKKHVTTVKNFPMGIDTDVIKSLVDIEPSSTLISNIIKQTLGTPKTEESLVDKVFQEQKVILGTDRIDYTKGILLRLQALDTFYAKYPQYKGKATYVGILAPSRSEIPAYIALREQMVNLAKTINDKYQTPNWQPIHLITGIFSRKEIVNAYRKSAVCLVTPLDDGMNLVAKEFVMASVFSDNPGMLVLSQFAGAAIDLTSSVIVNPYSIESTAEAIKKALEMSPKEKKERIKAMTEILEERNVYHWTESFILEAEHAARENRSLRLA